MHTPINTIREPSARPLRAALIYAAVAGLWILLSDKLVSLIFKDPELITLASMLKGWAFVGVTALLLYALLARRERAAYVGASDTAIPDRSGIVLIALAILLIAVVAVTHTLRRYHDDEVANLKSIANAKSRQVADWLTEHRRDTDFLASSRFVADSLKRLRGGDAEALREMEDRLEQFCATRGYLGVTLVDADGGSGWRSRAAPEETGGPLRTALAAAISGQRSTLTEPYLAASGMRRLDLVAPLTGPGKSRLYVVLHIDLTRTLYPLLRDWPLPLNEAEVLLLRSVDGTVHLVSPLHDDDRAALVLRHPASESERLAVRAFAPAALQEQVISGRDSRGREAIGVAQHVDGSDWMLLAQTSTAGIHARASRDAAWIGFSGILALFMALAGFTIYRQRERLDLMNRMGQAQAEKLQALQLLDAIAAGSGDAIFAKDTAGSYLLFNQAAAGFVGKSPDEVIGHGDELLFPSAQAARIRENDRKVVRESRVFTTEETLDTVAGSRVFLATKGPLLDPSGAVVGSFGISRDITEIKSAQAELQQRNDELERFNRATVGRELDMIELKRRINALSVELGRPPPYPLAFEPSIGHGEPDAAS